VIPKRLLPLLLVFVVLTSISPAVSASPESIAASLAKIACAMPHEWLLRIWRGYRPDRSAQIQLVPKQPNFVGSGLPHVGPWPYDQDVPMLWYGPGYIKPGVNVARPVTLADIPDTQAALLNYPFASQDGKPMSEALVPASQRQTPPRLIVTLVWDAGGRNVLNQWPNSWPVLKSLIPQGSWYDDATVGSSPTSTAQDHASIGTGDFPQHSGIVAHHVKIGNTIQGPWTHGPGLMITPTLADLYDRSTGNRSVDGAIATVNIHLGMLSHGSMWGGGDKDPVVLRTFDGPDATLGQEGSQWNLPDTLTPYFRFPSYVTDLPPLSRFTPAIDRSDGAKDGMWFDNNIRQLLGGFDTPARIPYQTKVVESVIKREGFGQDATPDMLFINYKSIDYVSHSWSMNSKEMEDTVRVQDEYLKVMIDYLNKQVGHGKWAMVLTADHGAVPSPAVSGAFLIATVALSSDINQHFDTDGDNVPIVQQVYQTQIFINMQEMQQNGVTLDQISQFVLGLTKADTAAAGTTVPPQDQNDKVFQSVFPSAMMTQLPPGCLPEAHA
jgi:hypothetical protein